MDKKINWVSKESDLKKLPPEFDIILKEKTFTWRQIFFKIHLSSTFNIDSLQRVKNTDPNL